MISSGGSATRGTRSIEPSLLSYIWMRFSSQTAYSRIASGSLGLRARILESNSSAPEKSLSATSSRAPWAQAPISSFSAGAEGSGSSWMPQAEPCSSSVSPGDCGSAIDGPSSQGVGLGGYEAGGGGGGRAGGLGVVGTSPSHGCAPPGSGSG